MPKRLKIREQKQSPIPLHLTQFKQSNGPNSLITARPNISDDFTEISRPKMRPLALLALFCWLSLQNCAISAPNPPENTECSWLYKCCQFDANQPVCVRLCPHPEIVCEPLGAGLDKLLVANPRHILVAPNCKEGYRLDPRGRCRSVF